MNNQLHVMRHTGCHRPLQCVCVIKVLHCSCVQSERIFLMMLTNKFIDPFFIINGLALNIDQL